MGRVNAGKAPSSPGELLLMGGDGATVPKDSKKWKTASIKIMSRDLKILPVSRDMNRKPTDEELWPRNRQRFDRADNLFPAVARNLDS